MKIPRHLQLKKSDSIYEADLKSIFLKDYFVISNPKKQKVSLTKKEKLRIITWMCGPKIASDFDICGISFVNEKNHKKIIDAFEKLCAYNKVIPMGTKFSDYCNALAAMPDKDYVIPAEFIK